MNAHKHCLPLYCIRRVSYNEGINTHPRLVFALLSIRKILLQSRVGCTADTVREVTAEMIASSDKGSDTDPFADLDEDEDQTEEN